LKELKVLETLEAAWKKREIQGCFKDTEALRLFYGPGEGKGFLEQFAIDQFGAHCWITEWQSSKKSDQQTEISEITEFLKTKAFKSAVALFRPEKNVPGEPVVLFGAPPEGRFEVTENGARFWIQLLNVKHPGLFLDHAPLRKWLMSHSRDARVLNTFAYTGSLSVASGLGGASYVTTLDLSKPTTEWARENWILNGLPESSADFIFGDYFEWLPKMLKRKQLFDIVILDPPSYSRGKKGDFSTSRDLIKLHELALDVLAPQGLLITSLNSANVSKKKYWDEIQEASRSKKMKLTSVQEISLPESFPMRDREEPYLKGWVLRRV
jgi:23S rRNA G2069 N7-methylase RlmK/C1962 C5-methylase RlmI